MQVPTLPCNIDPVWSSWDSLFQMNIRSRNLSFTAAKLIDIAFDLIIGSGGQMYLAWMAYNVYTDVLQRVTEKGKIGCVAFAAITLKPDSLMTIWSVVAAVFSIRHVRVKILLIWMVLAMAYVVAFPTAMSAATSPVAATTISIRLNGNETAPLLPYVESAAYSFANTGLEDKPNPWILPASEVTGLVYGFCDMGPFSGHRYGGKDYYSNSIVVNGTQYMVSSNATATCGFYYESLFYPFDMSRLDNSGLVVAKIFPSDQIVCVPDSSGSYQWGASWELLILILIAQVCWLASLLVIWLLVTARSPRGRQSRKMGKWRGMLDLAGPLLEKLGPNAEWAGDDELGKEVKTMSISYVREE
ncbi:hypothetical protein G7054_g10878 [Neopestalotiopsis clavispora]|nr:hypothetical protein G7054_g10878 [Neopestalotiopsis clavispora]